RREAALDPAAVPDGDDARHRHRRHHRLRHLHRHLRRVPQSGRGVRRTSIRLAPRRAAHGPGPRHRRSPRRLLPRARRVAIGSRGGDETMSDFHIVYTLFASSARLQRKRAYLTIAAIAWGTVAILMLLAFGEGLRRQLDKNRRSTGENLAVIWPSETSKPYKGLPAGRPIRPRVSDVDFVRERMPELRAVHGEMQIWRPAVYGRTTKNLRVIGANWSYGESRKHYPQAGGRFIVPDDEVQRRRVIFLGDEIAKDLFGDEKPVGKTLLVANSPYLVIGVMQHKTQMG